MFTSVHMYVYVCMYVCTVHRCTYTLCVHVCVDVCESTCTQVHEWGMHSTVAVWRSEDNLWELLLSFQHGGPRDYDIWQ